MVKFWLKRIFIKSLMDHDFVKEQLTKLGYKNLTDELIDEFLEKMQEDDELPIIPTIPRRFHEEIDQQINSTERKNSHNVIYIEKSSQQNTVSKRNQTNVKSTNSIQSARKNHKSKAISKKDVSKDDEILEWSSKLKSIKKKGKKLDDHIQRYRSTTIKLSDEIIDIPIYFGPDAERIRDPYPFIKKRKSGGFIRPPPIRGTRKYIHPNGHKLTYEERFPYYIPVPERRRDELRWRIRQKLVYSDPKYH